MQRVTQSLAEAHYQDRVRQAGRGRSLLLLRRRVGWWPMGAGVIATKQAQVGKSEQEADQGLRRAS
jgi:hypothetical protein